MPESAYVHIPFCKRKCNYCSFISFTDLSLQDLYTEKLLDEIKHYYKKEKLKTLYIGGGTPSLLTINNLEKILNCFDFCDNPEITVEVNPESADDRFLKDLKSIGFNRLSVGVQSFDDSILKNIGRLHDTDKAVSTVKSAQDNGFTNINIDLIYGLPEQSLKSFEDDLKQAIHLKPQHISLYGLKIEEGTEFAKKKPANLADEDLQADMYINAIDIMKCFGYLHYEFSNFAKKWYESNHNLNYWDNEEYYGFGISAHGYVDKIRYSNRYEMTTYLENPLKKENEHLVSFEEMLEEEIFLGLRKCSGINLKKILRKYQIDFDTKYREIVSKYLASKHLIKTNEGYKLSLEGILISNIILSDFLYS